MEENNKQNYELSYTSNLQNVLAVLKQEDAQEILRLKDEIADNWNKNQIFRTETEMRISVLNDAKHPTPASKYWQSVREMSAHFDALMNLSFEMRRCNVKRLKLENKMKEVQENGDSLEVMEIQIDLDQNLYELACMNQITQDRVREIKTWSKIKSELNDGTFDDKNVNTHQSESLGLRLENRVKALGPNSESSEVINALGPLQTLNRLKTKDNTLLNFKEANQKQISQESQNSW
jgi:hypothetical protein